MRMYKCHTVKHTLASSQTWQTGSHDMGTDLGFHTRDHPVCLNTIVT